MSDEKRRAEEEDLLLRLVDVLSDLFAEVDESDPGELGLVIASRLEDVREVFEEANEWLEAELGD